MNNCEELLRERTEYSTGVIEHYLPDNAGYLSELISAMTYSVKAGGKRLRPIFIDSAYRMLGGTDKRHEPFMAAMEYLHTYSLVHDDMPAIDNDDMRRGMPTTHKKYGEACALLAGDGLLHWSTQTALIAFGFCRNDRERENVICALNIFADKSGPNGMLGGQSVDVLFTGKDPDKERLDYIYRLKTCALIEGSLMIGAALAGAHKEQLAVMEQIGRCVGLAFQIRDDILDCTGDEKAIGKPVNSDRKNGKTTYVTLFGSKEAEAEVETLSAGAKKMLRELEVVNEEEKEFLLWLFEYLAKRNR